MTLAVKELPEIFKPFFEKSTNGDGHATLLGKNLAHTKELESRKYELQVKNEVLMGFENLKAGIPNEPNGSFAGSHILRVASAMADPANAPLFISALSWDWIRGNAHYLAYILEAARQGCEEDVPVLQRCRDEFVALEKREPENSRILCKFDEAISACMVRRGRTTATATMATNRLEQGEHAWPPK